MGVDAFLSGAAIWTTYRIAPGHILGSGLNSAGRKVSPWGCVSPGALSRISPVFPHGRSQVSVFGAYSSRIF